MFMTDFRKRMRLKRELEQMTQEPESASYLNSAPADEYNVLDVSKAIDPDVEILSIFKLEKNQTQRS